MAEILAPDFFDRDAQRVARQLLGKILRHRVRGYWLAARIIETEAYYTREKGSHSSLGYTEARRAMFMPPGTIYMYFARGRSSLNISCRGKGNAVLIKSAFPYTDKRSPQSTIRIMQSLHGQERPVEKLCNGQTLLCTALDLHVPDWNARTFNRQQFHVEDTGEHPGRIIQTRRLGIPAGRDEHLMYRFIDYDFARYCTANPLRKRGFEAGRDYRILTARG
jgi:DNA-3-methyladenine glycosylase